MVRITRRAVRYEVHLPVIEVNQKAVTEGYLLDISALGAKLDLPFALAPRGPVTFGFVSPGKDTILRLNGMVVWMQADRSKPGRFRHGLQFYQPQWDIDRLAPTWRK